MYKYSFIIPHKNCPDLLQRCVDSIPEREDVQVIVVDDNSDADKKPQLSRKDVEVILLDAEHSKGAGRARNVGLQHAKGKWLLFADADDYYTDYLPMLLNKYVDDARTDIVYLNACIFDENGNERPHEAAGLIINFLKGNKGAEMHLRYSIWTPWTRMVKSHVVERYQISFDEIPACNDKMFCLLCSYFAKKIDAESKVIYKYFKPTTGSQTDKNRNHLMFDGLLDVRCRTIDLYKKAGYKPIPSILDLFSQSKYTLGLSKRQIIKNYFDNLSKAHVFFLRDIFRFIFHKLK